MSTFDSINEKLRNNEKEHSAIMEKIDEFGKKLEDVSVKIASLPDQILERADRRYASKTAEKLIYGLVGVVCAAFVMALWELISE